MYRILLTNKLTQATSEANVLNKFEESRSQTATSRAPIHIERLDNHLVWELPTYIGEVLISWFRMNHPFHPIIKFTLASSRLIIRIAKSSCDYSLIKMMSHTQFCICTRHTDWPYVNAFERNYVIDGQIAQVPNTIASIKNLKTFRELFT